MDRRRALFFVSDEGYRDLLEVEGLYLSDLLILRLEDRNDPGSVPVAVEAQGEEPILASLYSFEAAGDFQEPADDEDTTSAKVAVGEFRFFAPILADVEPDPTIKRLRVLPGKGKGKKKRPKPNLIMKCRAKSHDLELFHDPESDEVFLYVAVRQDDGQ